MLSFAHGAVQWSSADPAATDYVVSGLGFQPKALMFVTVGIQSATDAASEAVDQQQNLAFATSTSDRRVLHAYGMDNSATIRNQMAYRTDCIACTSTHAETDVNGRLDLSAIGSDGFTLTVDDQGVQDVTVLWFAWGGDDIANVETFEFAEPATATTVAVKLTGAFQPDVILVAGSAISGTAPVFDGGAPAGISLGFATPTDQIVVVMHSDDNAGSADADGYIRSGEIFAMVEESGAGMTLHASVQSFDADGVTFSFSEVSGVATRRAIGLAMRGGQWDVGGYVINATGAGNTATVSGLAFQPAGGLGFTRGTAENASDTSTGDGVMSVGAWSSTTSRRALGILDENGTGNAELNQVVEYDQYLAIPSAAGGLAEAYDISAVNSDGFQVIVDTANAGGSTTQLQGYLVFASAAGGASVGPGNLAQLQALDAPTLTQTHVLAPGGLVQSQVFDAPGLTQDHQLSPADLAQSQIFDAPGLTQDHQLSPGDVDQLQTFDAPTITQDHQLAPAELAQEQVFGAPTVSVENTLTPNDLAQLQAFDVLSITQDHQLTVADLSQVQALDAVTLTQTHQLTVGDIVQLEALDAPSLSQEATVSPQGLAQEQVIQAVAITQDHQLAVVDLVQLQAFDPAGLTQTHILSVSDIAQLQVIGGAAVVLSGYLVVTSIRFLPALDADGLSVSPALTGTPSIKPN